MTAVCSVIILLCSCSDTAHMIDDGYRKHKHLCVGIVIRGVSNKAERMRGLGGNGTTYNST